MDLNTQQLIQAQQSRLDELEMWMALLIARHGLPNADPAMQQGYTYTVCGHHAEHLRAKYRMGQLCVSIEADPESDTFQIVAL